MKTKLIEIHGCKHSNQVLLNRFTDEDYSDIYPVEISAWHKYDADADNAEFESWQQEIIEFPSALMAERFIADYAEITANEFANDYAPF